MNWTFNKRGEIINSTHPIIMAIVNVTNKSFLKSSHVLSDKDFLLRVEKYINEGASIIDIGACATNPFADTTTLEEEWENLRPFLYLIQRHFANITLSIDTFRAEIADRATQITPIDIINDISGCIDENMPNIIAKRKLSYVLTYNNTNSHFDDNVALRSDMLFSLSKKIDFLHKKGVSDIIVDPGLGFNKSIEQNYNILSHLEEMKMLDCPILIGLSHKRMIYQLLNKNPEDVVSATTALHLFALQKGCAVLRVHDVAETMDIIKIFQTLC